MLNNNRALLVVDLQQNYINENVFPRTAQIARGVEQELQHGYQLVLVTRMHVQPHGPLEVEPELPALGFEPLERALFFVKQTLSAATDEVLTLLAGHGIHRVDICGISTESCVMATAFALHGFGISGERLGSILREHRRQSGRCQDRSQQSHLPALPQQSYSALDAAKSLNTVPYDYVSCCCWVCGRPQPFSLGRCDKGRLSGPDLTSAKQCNCQAGPATINIGGILPIATPHQLTVPATDPLFRRLVARRWLGTRFPAW